MQINDFLDAYIAGCIVDALRLGRPFQYPTFECDTLISHADVNESIVAVGEAIDTHCHVLDDVPAPNA